MNNFILQIYFIVFSTMLWSSESDQTVFLEQQVKDNSLVQAYKNNNFKGMKKLLKEGANPNNALHNDWPLLLRAAHDENSAFVKLLIQHGANVYTVERQEGYRIIHIAIDTANLKLVRWLLNKYPDLKNQSTRAFGVNKRRYTPYQIVKQTLEDPSIKPKERKRLKKIEKFFLLRRSPRIENRNVFHP